MAKTSQLGTGNTASFMKRCAEGEGGESDACAASPGSPHLAPQTSHWQKAELPEHGETVQQENGSLGVKYNSPVQLWNISPGEKAGVRG